MAIFRRFTFLASVMVVLCVASFSAVTGCQSQPVAYSNAATPLADDLIGDFDRYTLSEKDVSVATENTSLSVAFRGAIARGDANTAASRWFGNGNIRSRLLNYWAIDTKFQTPSGIELQRIKLHNVEAFDYVLTVGDTQQSK